MASGSLMPAEGVSETGWEPYKTRQGKAGGADCRHPSPDQTSPSQPCQQWRDFYCIPRWGM